MIGLGLDQNTNNFQLRWWLVDQAARLESRARAWASPTRSWTAGSTSCARRSAPPLTANRTMGSLGGLVASRIAREFRIGGPSFSVSCDETSGTQALQLAASWLRSGELDAAIVGAVDLAGRHPRRPRVESSGSDEAPARRGGGGPGAQAARRRAARRRSGLRDRSATPRRSRDGPSVRGECRGRPSRRIRVPLECAGDRLGRQRDRPAGAATGLASVARAALCLYQQILPATRCGGRSSGSGTATTARARLP